MRFRSAWAGSLALALAACGLTVVGVADPAKTPEDAGADPSLPEAAAEPAEAGSEGEDAGDAGNYEPVESDAAYDGGPVLLRWNLGGPAYAGSVTAPGPWAAGEVGIGPCGPSTFSVTGAILGTTDDVLYQSEVFGNPLRCVIGSGLAAGTYRVRLHFAEVYFGTWCPADAGGVGSRVFDIEIEGQKLETALDPYDVSGGCAASTVAVDAGPFVRELEVAVTDGTLNIVMPASANNAKLSALEVEGPL